MDLRYLEGDSRLHRMHPVIKAAVLLLLVSASLIYGAAVNTALAALLVLLALASGLGVRKIAGMLKPVPVFVLIIVAANLLLVRNSEPYTSDIGRGLLQGGRVFVLILSAGLFWAVTDPARFSDSVVFLGAPLKVFGIEKDDISLILMIVFSFIPHISEEVERIRRARLVRCGHGGWLSIRKGGVLPVIMPLITSLLRRGEELELALSARHYRPGAGSGRERIPFPDIVVGMLFLIIFVFGLYAKY